MSRCVQFTIGWLWAGGLLAVLLIGPQAISAQASVRLSPIASDLAQPSPQVQSNAPSRFTPEEIGDAMMFHQRYQAAIQAYRKSPRMTAVLWNKLGIAYQMLFDLHDASDCYKRSLALNPRYAKVLNNLGTIEDQRKNYKSAERYYRKALKIDPSSALLYKNLGTNLLSRRKFEEGWNMYKKALALDPAIFARTNNPKTANPSTVRERGVLNYFMAKGCARTGHPNCALEYLARTLNEGFASPKEIAADVDFSSLRGTPGFDELIGADDSQRSAKLETGRLRGRF